MVQVCKLASAMLHRVIVSDVYSYMYVQIYMYSCWYTVVALLALVLFSELQLITRISDVQLMGI